MTQAELDATVLNEVARQEAQIRRRPRPEPWRRWDVQRDEEDRERGPLYSPQWFGALAADEAGRVRFLRTVRRLEAAGLLAIGRSPAGKLERVKLTKAGRKAVADAAKAG